MLSSNIAIFQPFYPPAYLGGGPIRTIHALVNQATKPEELFIVASDRDLGETERLPVRSNSWTKSDSGANIYFMSDDSFFKYLRGLQQIRRQHPRIIYLNSIFNIKYAIVPQLGRMLHLWRGALIVVAPRGELGRGALELKSAKKRAFLSAFRLTGLPKDLIWHASSDLELSEIRSVFGAAARVCVRQDETDLPANADMPIEGSTGPLCLVFLSRISRVKGLHILLRALVDVTAEVRLDVYGSAQDTHYYRECMRIVSLMPENVSVRFNGSIHPTLVRGAIAKVDAFVLPTAGENFGHVIAESLSVSCPVLVADVTPWSAVIESGGGVLMSDTSPESWTREIQRLATATASQRFARKQEVADAYLMWRSENHGPNIFALVPSTRVEQEPS